VKNTLDKKYNSIHKKSIYEKFLHTRTAALFVRDIKMKDEKIEHIVTALKEF